MNSLKQAVIFFWIRMTVSPAFYLVRYVLLLCGGVTFGVDESGVGHQVPSVLHNEAPTK